MAETKYNITLKAKDKTAREFQKLNRNIDNTQRAMKRIAGAFAGAFAVRQLVQFGNEALATADAIGKVADSAGVSAEFLQKYQFAAQQSGLTTEEFNKGLQNFTKMVGQAQLRTSEAGRSLEKLGVQTKKADGSIRNTEDVFVDLFTALDDVGSQFQKNAILADLMGRAGVKLAVMGKDGAAAMKELAESATGVIDDETIDKAERFNDTMNRLKRQVLEPLQTLFIDVADGALKFGEAMGLLDAVESSLVMNKAELVRLQEIEAEQKLRLEGVSKRNETAAQIALDNTQTEIKLLEEKIRLQEEEARKRKENQANILLESEELQEQMKVIEQFQNTVEGKLTTAMSNFFDYTKKEFLDFGELSKRILSEVINELIRTFLVKQMVGGIMTGIGSLGRGGAMPDLTQGKLQGMGGADFEGGGFTGFGSRTGGIDGRGGFPAILHPNETVIDHTKGQGMGATVNFNITTVDAANFDALLTSRKGLITSIINNAMNSKGKMGVV